jgi:hypothetical protein
MENMVFFGLFRPARTSKNKSRRPHTLVQVKEPEAVTAALVVLTRAGLAATCIVFVFIELQVNILGFARILDRAAVFAIPTVSRFRRRFLNFI